MKRPPSVHATAPKLPPEVDPVVITAQFAAAPAAGIHADSHPCAADKSGNASVTAGVLSPIERETVPATLPDAELYERTDAPLYPAVLYVAESIW